MNKTNILGLCILILLVIIPISYSYEEKNSVARIVGESPTEMLKQMKRTELNIGEAIYYTHDQYNNDKENILKKQFGDIEGKGFHWLQTYDYDDVE